MSLKYYLWEIITFGANMDRIILGWEINEVEQLLDRVSSRNKKSLIHVFSEFATKTCRSVASVRNYYYRLLKMIPNDNKIRSLCKEHGVSIKNDTENTFMQNAGQIVVMPHKREVLSQSDIDSLFWGLVKLVKRNTEKEVQLNIKREIQLSNDTLSSTLALLKKKEAMLKKLQLKNKSLRDEIETIQNDASKIRIDTIEDYTNKFNLEQLKIFLKKLKKREVKNEKL